MPLPPPTAVIRNLDVGTAVNRDAIAIDESPMRSLQNGILRTVSIDEAKLSAAPHSRRKKQAAGDPQYDPTISDLAGVRVKVQAS